MKRGITLAALASVLTFLLSAATAALPAPAGGSSSLAASASATSQPTVIPGKWKLTEQPLPPVGDILKRPAAAMPVYGLYVWCGEYKTHRDSIKKVGWKSFRVGGPMTDEDMKMFVEDGVEVMKCLQVQNVAGMDWAKAKKNRNDFASDEEFIAAYVKCIEAFLERYGPDGTFFKDNPKMPKRPVLFLEIWNEPNFQYMIPDSNDRKKDNAQRDPLYAKVLSAAHAAIKKRWPAVQVVGFGAGGAAADDVRFVRNVLDADAKAAKSFDILSTHPYVTPAPPETDAVRSWGTYSIAKGLDAIRKTLAEHGAGQRPIWYSEVGWPITKADGGFYETKEKDLATPLLQAAYVCRLYAYSVRLGVERVHIMFATDTDNFNAGFFLRDGKWRPSATAVQNMINLLPFPRFERAISDGADGYYAYSFFYARTPTTEQPGDAHVVMAWNVEGPKTVEIPIRGSKAGLVDMLGNEKPLEVKDGKVTVEVGPLPVYVRE